MLCKFFILIVCVQESAPDTVEYLFFKLDKPESLKALSFVIKHSIRILNQIRRFLMSTRDFFYFNHSFLPEQFISGGRRVWYTSLTSPHKNWLKSRFFGYLQIRHYA